MRVRYKSDENIESIDLKKNDLYTIDLKYCFMFLM